jgi:hypothetical protein
MPSRTEKEKFSKTIIELAANLKIDHIDAMTTYCERNSIEIEMAAKLINESLRQRIKSDAIESRVLPSESRLKV